MGGQPERLLGLGFEFLGQVANLLPQLGIVTFGNVQFGFEVFGLEFLCLEFDLHLR